ncbi:hypothetical protein [Gramella sp. AN32]|uniref:Uncharacterized protein n=1 Tax=Christiangramia antarctica TaxID=2058158 RepID=A0ABW5X6L5_9FLAO|nr:hypothetical protein [Gramella sp. AN32]MCM4158249.1 hypothetical protein [Gramella sp. AN32]
MSQVSHCPTCGGTSKIKEKDGKIIYQAVQDDEAFKKVAQLKKVIEKLKGEIKTLEKELRDLKSK